MKLLAAYFIALGVSLHSPTWAFEKVPHHAGATCFTHALEETIPQIKLLGNGTSAENDAFLSHWNHQQAVFLKTKELSLDQLKRKQLGVYNKLSRMTTEDAYRYLKDFHLKEKNYYQAMHARKNPSSFAMFQLKPEEKAIERVASNLVHFDQLSRASHLTFEGRPILATPYTLVRNGDHVPVGSLIEFVHGKTLNAQNEIMRLSDHQLDAIFHQIEGQLRVLHEHGFIHGDLHEENIILEMTKPDQPIVRLIDMTYLADSAKSTPDHDWEYLSELKEKIGYRGH